MTDQALSEVLPCKKNMRIYLTKDVKILSHAHDFRNILCFFEVLGLNVPRVNNHWKLEVFSEAVEDKNTMECCCIIALSYKMVRLLELLDKHQLRLVLQQLVCYFSNLEQSPEKPSKLRMFFHKLHF